LTSAKSGTTVRHTSPARILETIIPVPAIKEQKKIADCLNLLEKNIFAKQNKLNHIKSLKKALMQDLLTGKVRAIN
jgi:type I restriction enzyme S subunit